MKSKYVLFGIALMSIFLFGLEIASATEIFNQTHQFSVLANDNTTVNTNSISVTLQGTSGTLGTIRHVTVNFNQIKVLNEFKAPVSNNTGQGCGLSFKAAASGIVTKLVPMTAYISGQVYGTGSIGWQRSPPATTNSQFNYYLIFDSVDTTFANSLSGDQVMTFVYDTSVFTSYINAPAYPSGCTNLYSINSYSDLYMNIIVGTNNAGNQIAYSVTGGTYNVQYSNTATISLLVNQLSSNFAYVNLTRNSNNILFQTTDINNNIIYQNTATSAESQYTDIRNGLRVNNEFVSQLQWWNNSILDVGGIPIITPTPLPTPSISPITGSGLLWDANNYSLNDIGTLSYLTDSSWFDYGSTYRIEIYKNNPSVLEQTFDNVGVSGQVHYQFNEVGSYTANFIKWRLFDTTLDSKTVTVTLNPSYLYINTTVAAGTPFNVGYIFGNVVQSQGELNSLQFKKYEVNELISYKTLSLNNTAIVAGTQYNFSAIIGTPGKYKALLYDFTRGVIAERIFTVVSGFIQPTTHISTSYITTDMVSYFLNDNIEISYGIDDTNFSNYPSKYIVIYQANTANTTIEVLFQENSFVLVPANYIATAVGIGKITLKQVKTGTNTIALHAISGTSDIILASTAFTVSGIDSDGYGLDISASKICTGKSIPIKYSAPDGGTVEVKLYKANSNPFIYDTKAVNGSNKSFNLRFSFDGTYYIRLLDTSGNERYSWQLIASTDNCESVVVSTPVATTGASKVTDDILGNGLYVALLILIVFAVMGHTIGGLGGAVIGFGSGFIMTAVYGFIPTWALFLFAIVVIVVLAILFGKNLTGSD